MTPDWAAKAVAVPYSNYGNPQSLNLYSYVTNNPTTLCDLDGHDGGAAVTADAVFDFLVGGTEASAPAWAVGSVALPGMIGGGLAYKAIDSTATNNYTVADAQMQDVAATNKLMAARQVALSQDAEAGALTKAGKDANKAGAEAIADAINRGARKGVSPKEFEDDKKGLNEGMKDVERKIEDVKNATGQKARDAAKKALEKATKEVKNHAKELKQRTEPEKK
jgi:hypothetical protein